MSCVIALCIFILVFGFITAYEQTVFIGTGEYKKAIEITEDTIRIFDFEIDIKRGIP